MTFQTAQENFTGPLDLLLELIEGEKLSITQISLAKVAEDYLRHVRALEKINPEQLAEFLVVAAQLMLIKSRSLLPRMELAPEEEETADELKHRLEEYRLLKEAAKRLETALAAKKFIFSREAYSGMEPVFYPPPATTKENLAEVMKVFLTSLPQAAKLAQEKIKKIISLEERIRHIQNFLRGAVEKAFSEVITGAGEKVDVIVSFLAILELAKQKFVQLEQKNLFQEIIIKPHEKS